MKFILDTSDTNSLFCNSLLYKEKTAYRKAVFIGLRRFGFQDSTSCLVLPPRLRSLPAPSLAPLPPFGTLVSLANPQGKIMKSVAAATCGTALTAVQIRL